MHIAIEGIDGVGKTTLAKTLAERIGFKFIEKPLHYLFDTEADGNYPVYMQITSKINALSDKSIRARFYGLGNFYLRRGLPYKNIVTDRHLVSNYYWNGDNENETMFKDLINNIGKPEITFLITASQKVRYLRIKKRNPNDPDLNKIYEDLDPYAKMEFFLQRYDFFYQKIDTSELSINQTVNMMLETINRFSKNIVTEN